MSHSQMRRRTPAAYYSNELFHLAGLLTTDGILLECNRALLNGGGLTRDDVIGKPFWETFWWTVTPKAQEDLHAARR